MCSCEGNIWISWRSFYSRTLLKSLIFDPQNISRVWNIINLLSLSFLQPLRNRVGLLSHFVPFRVDTNLFWEAQEYIMKDPLVKSFWKKLFSTLTNRKSSMRRSFIEEVETLETVKVETVVIEIVEVETGEMENKSEGLLVSLFVSNFTELYCIFGAKIHSTCTIVSEHTPCWIEHVYYNITWYNVGSHCVRRNGYYSTIRCV